MLPAVSLPLAAMTPCTGAGVLWRARGRLGMTVIVKATFAFRQDAPAALIEPRRIVERDEHFDKVPTNSVSAASDLAPFLPGSGVTLVGHAYAEPRTTHASAALTVWRGAPLMRKVVYVYGDAPFSHVPLRYDAAGVRIVDAENLQRRSGFGALGWDSRERLALAGDVDPRALRERPELGDDFDHRYFHAAPRDQQWPQPVEGDEWLVLQGLHPRHPLVRTRLPNARARARVGWRAGSTLAWFDVPLVGDTIAIEADRELFSVVWRGHRALAVDEVELASLGVLVGVEHAGAATQWPNDLGPLSEQVVQAARGVASPFFTGSLVDPIAPDSATDAVPLAPEGADPEASEPAAPPARKGDVIPGVSDAHFQIESLTWQLKPPQDALVCIVKGTYDLVDGQTVARETSDGCTGEVHWQDDAEASVVYPSDLAVLKPRADVVAGGHAHAPKPGTTSMAVSFRFGHPGRAIERTLMVLGDRHWESGALSHRISDPLPFETIPIVYEHAFGGAGSAKNPCGRGQTPGGPLPNLELADRRVERPSDDLEPAAFAPIAAQWREPSSKMGTCDQRWLRTRWPYFPEDFDYRYFQAAPASQQLAAVRGDEPFEFHGMRPRARVLAGALPGERARCFAILRDPVDAAGQVSPERMREVKLVLDTVAFDLDAPAVHLVWRGHIDVSADDAPEVLNLFATREALDAPITTEEAASRYLAVISFPNEPAKPAGEPPTVAPLPEPLDPKLEQAARRLDDVQRDATEKVARAMAELGLDDMPQGEPDTEHIAEVLRDAGAAPGEIEEVLEALEAPPSEPSPAAAEAEEPSMRQRVIAMLEAGERFDGFDFEEADLSDLDFSTRFLTRAVLQRCNLQRTSFDYAVLSDAQLGEADCTEASFRRALLAQADLTRAKLDAARFERAFVMDAELMEATGRGACFDGAQAHGAFFDHGDWSGATFTGAVLAGAELVGSRLDGARFDDAVLHGAGMRDVQGRDVVFDGADLADAALDGAELPGASFSRVKASGAVFERAQLDRARFHGADLSRASFLRASCRKALFAQADLREARLKRAALAGSDFQRANLMHANLEAADLQLADLRGANLHAAGLWKANLEHAKLDDALVTMSTLVARPPQ